MEIMEITNTHKEIFVDEIPIGSILLNEQKKIEKVEIYSNLLKTRYDANLLFEFIKVITDRPWADQE